VQSDLLDFAGTGMSILEMSHRSATYEQLHNQAIVDLRTLLGGTEDHAILFMGGGAQMQFALVALNLLSPGSYAEYLVTGVWSETALSETTLDGNAVVVECGNGTHSDTRSG
jgi:phosphoserine aminotransferase